MPSLFMLVVYDKAACVPTEFLLAYKCRPALCSRKCPALDTLWSLLRPNFLIAGRGWIPCMCHGVQPGVVSLCYKYFVGY